MRKILSKPKRLFGCGIILVASSTTCLAQDIAAFTNRVLTPAVMVDVPARPTASPEAVSLGFLRVLVCGNFLDGVFLLNDAQRIKAVGTSDLAAVSSNRIQRASTEWGAVAGTNFVITGYTFRTNQADSVTVTFSFTEGASNTNNPEQTSIDLIRIGSEWKISNWDGDDDE